MVAIVTALSARVVRSQRCSSALHFFTPTRHRPDDPSLAAWRCSRRCSRPTSAYPLVCCTQGPSVLPPADLTYSVHSPRTGSVRTMGPPSGGARSSRRSGDLARSGLRRREKWENVRVCTSIRKWSNMSPIASTDLILSYCMDYDHREPSDRLFKRCRFLS